MGYWYGYWYGNRVCPRRLSYFKHVGKYPRLWSKRHPSTHFTLIHQSQMITQPPIANLVSSGVLELEQLWPLLATEDSLIQHLAPDSKTRNGLSGPIIISPSSPSTPHSRFHPVIVIRNHSHIRTRTCTRNHLPRNFVKYPLMRFLRRTHLPSSSTLMAKDRHKF